LATTPRVSIQRLADVSAPNDSAHQGEWERHSRASLASVCQCLPAGPGVNPKSGTGRFGVAAMWLATGACGDAQDALRGHRARGSYRGRSMMELKRSVPGHHLTIFNFGTTGLSSKSIVCLNRSFFTNAA